MADARLQAENVNDYATFRNSMLKHTVLSEQEERVILKSIKETGSKQALDKLVRHNLKFVFNVAKNYAEPYEPEFWEYFNEGCCGLIKAARRFELEKDVKFMSYAVWWIRQHMSLYKKECLSFIRVSAKTRADTKQKYLDSLAKNAPERKLVEKFGMRALYLSTDAHIESLDAPDPTVDGATRMDSLPDTNPNQVTPEFQTLQKALDSLTERERGILLLYHGVTATESFTLAELGSRYSMSRERVRQLKDVALKKVRGKLGLLQLQFHDFDLDMEHNIADASAVDREDEQRVARIQARTKSRNIRKTGMKKPKTAPMESLETHTEVYG